MKEIVVAGNGTYEEWMEFLKNIPLDPVLKYNNMSTVSFPNGQVILYNEYQIIFGKVDKTNFLMHRISGPVFINKFQPTQSNTYSFDGKLYALDKWLEIEEVKNFQDAFNLKNKILNL